MRRLGLIGAQRSAFNVPVDIAYFNTANLAPQLHAVRIAGEAALERRGRPWTISAADWFVDVERLRSLFGELIGTSGEGVAIVPATSYGFAVAARSLSLHAGQRVLVLDEEYPSGVYTWRAAARSSGAEIDRRSRAGANLDRRGACCPRREGRDCQRPECPLDRWRFRGSGSGRGAQPSTGGAVGHRWQSVGWRDAARHGRVAPRFPCQRWLQVVARRFDVGQRTQFELLPMAIAALEQIVDWQVPRVAATLAERTADIARRAAGLGLASMPDEQRGPHLLGVRIADAALAGAVSALATFNCFAAVRGASLRISPHLHTTDEDVERLVDGLTLATHASGG